MATRSRQQRRRQHQLRVYLLGLPVQRTEDSVELLWRMLRDFLGADPTSVQESSRLLLQRRLLQRLPRPDTGDVIHAGNGFSLIAMDEIGKTSPYEYTLWMDALASRMTPQTIFALTGDPPAICIAKA